VSQSRKYRILHLISSPRWTGVAEPAASLARQQMLAGHDVRAAAIWERSLEDGLKSRGIPLARGITLERFVNPIRIFREVRQLRDYLRREQIDVVHSHLLHDHWLAALAAKPLKKAACRPIVVRTVHRYEKMRSDPGSRFVFSRKQTDALITVSSEQRDLIVQAYSWWKDGVQLVRGAVDGERFRPDRNGAMVRADMGEPPENVVAGIVAHLGYNRGHDWLLQAAPAVLEQVPNAVIWIVGQGEIKYQLHARLKAPEFRGRVLMTGYRKEDLPETYAAMNVALLLGLGSEGSARAALEAMATGKPVIAVRKGALIDTISDGADGLLVPEGDVPALTAALVRLLGNPAEAARMGENARRKMLSDFTEQRRYEDTMRAYEAALQQVELR
jgi:glycosyltransferase involved in cell wall biosynthesis